MPVKSINIRRRDPKERLDLKVSVSGMVVSVEAGSFRINGVENKLLEDEHCKITAHPEYKTGVLASLVLADGVARVLLDEVVKDGVDQPFNLKDSGYTLLISLFDCIVPAGATDLNDVDVRVRRYVPFEEKQPEALHV